MKKFLIFISSAVLSFSFFTTPIMAVSPSSLSIFGDTKLGKDKAIILTGCADREDGVMCIIELVRDILSIGVGILGVIGISVVGIQYLTAGGNEEKTRKAKHRLFEIILGLAVYAVLAVLVSFLGVK